MNEPSEDDRLRAGDVARIEALLLASRRAAPSEAFRTRVLDAMEAADAERRQVLSRRQDGGAAPGRPWILPEAVAGAAAAMLVLGLVWQPKAQVAETRPEVGARPPAATGDVERSLELLEARRHRLLDLGIGTADARGAGVRDAAEDGLRGHLTRPTPG